MKPTYYFSFIIFTFVIIFTHGSALANDANLDVSEMLAVVPVKSGNVDQGVYRQFDRLVPKLKEISKSKIIKLECRYSGQPNREQDVVNAYKLATRIEKYLRVQHKLELDLWIAIDIKPKSAKSSPVLSIAVFSDDIKKLDTIQLDSPPNEQK
jgi:hypothetical protein